MQLMHISWRRQRLSTTSENRLPCNADSFVHLCEALDHPFRQRHICMKTGMTNRYQKRPFLTADAARDRNNLNKAMANLHTRKPGLGNNVILVQHTLEDLSFQVP